MMGAIAYFVMVIFFIGLITFVRKEVNKPMLPPREPPKEIVQENKVSEYFNIGRRFEIEYGKSNLTVKQVCEQDKGPRETNVVHDLGDGMMICSFGYFPTLVGHLENLLKTGTPKEIDDFNAGRLDYVEEKGKETLTIMDNASAIDKGTKQVETLRQGFEEIAVHKSPELQWKKNSMKSN